MKFRSRALTTTLGTLFVASLTACGGGGGGGDAATAASLKITGTAATGVALANASVAITDTAGASPCVETSITTTQLGSYTCTLKSGETAPFFIVVTDTTGNNAPLVSIATTTPVAGTPLLVNATPLTTAIVAQLNGGDALGVVANKALYVSANFTAAKANVIAQIQAVITAIDPTLTSYDPFTTSITAATSGSTGNTADQVLDVIKISKTTSGGLALSTISDPTPVPLATATVTGTSVSAPTTNVSDLAQAAQLAAKAFANCYAQPVSQRVTLDSNSNISAVSSACQNIVTMAGNPSGAPDFKSNGYNANQSFYSYLTSALMTNATFSVPEIMSFYPADSTHSRDRAVLNIRYLDNLGNPGNYITVAQNFPGSSSTSRPSNWWITGNQWNYDISVKTNVRRVQEYYPGYPSRFQNGLDLSIYGKMDAPNASQFDSALVTGPGLPSTGIWYIRSSVAYQFVVSSIRSTTPQTTASLISTTVCGVCSTFWMSRTAGISGSNAATLTSNNSNAQWAGSSDGSYNGANGTRPLKGAVYTFKIYNDGALVATETRTLLTDLVAATQEVNMPWNSIGPNTTAALDVNNSALSGTQTSLKIDWIQNSSAEQIKNVWISQTDGSYDNSTSFKLGATSVNAVPNGTNATFTSLTGTPSYNSAPYGGYREIGFSYRMLDGSTKNAVYTYYP